MLLSLHNQSAKSGVDVHAAFKLLYWTLYKSRPELFLLRELYTVNLDSVLGFFKG
jgi:hypothetical protein